MGPATSHVGVFTCAACHDPIPEDAAGTYVCRCGTGHRIAPAGLTYDWKRLLFEHFPKKFLLSSALNNNSYLGYFNLAEGSISLASREDVAGFRDYILAHAVPGRLIDIGCGVLDLPGYLYFGESAGKYSLFGIDPIESHTFAGVRVTGCSEFIPFADATFSTAIFATSLDHVCSLAQSLRETARIIEPGGKVLVWMGDRTGFRRELLREEAVRILRRLARRPYLKDVVNKHGRYFVYPDLTVFYVPKRAIDPFHSFNETPGKIVRAMRSHSLILEDLTRQDKNHVFLTFQKRER